MELQVLVSAVNQSPKELAEKMNLSTDAIIINQCDHFAYEEYRHGKGTVKCFSLAERGVGLSRNTALMRADAEICLFSDEDIVLNPDYAEKIISAFENNPAADVITFNVKVDASRATYCNKERKRIRWYNYGRYPTYAAAARTESLKRANVSFSLLFGGGAKYSNGEDSLFFHDCLKKGLRMYAETAEIGEEVYRESTWFTGYNRKFFFDRGVLYASLYGCMAKMMALRFLLAHKKTMCGEIPFVQAYRLMAEGIKEGSGR